MTLPAIHPLRPILSKTVPTGRAWIYELKLDGFRGMLSVECGRAWFRSKNSNRMRRFDALALSLARSLDAQTAILDGEIVVMGPHGPDFKDGPRRAPAKARHSLRSTGRGHGRISSRLRQ